jgi:hypothetical protein
MTVAVSLPAYASPTLTPVADVPTALRITTHGSGLVLSSHYPFGTPNNLTAVDSAGNVSPFSALAGFTRVPDVKEAPPNCTAYGPGCLYFSDDDIDGYLGAPTGPRHIYKVSADGATTSVFATMPTDWPVSCLAFDTTGTWGNLLFAATEDGALYCVAPNGVARPTINLGGRFNWPTVYAEGLTIMPTSDALGPWSGAILLIHVTNGGAPGSGIVTAIRPVNRQLTFTDWSTGDLKSVISLTYIPPGQNCYVASYGAGKVLGISASDMAPYAGQVLACVRDDTAKQGVWAIQWNGAAFTTAPVALQPGSRLQGAVFTKAGIAGIPPAP